MKGIAMDHLRLGKRRARYDRRTLQLANYTAAMPNPPTSVNWARNITTWPMWLNDSIGDCTIAGCNRLRQIWTKNTLGTPAITSDADTLTAYEAVSGYTPGNPATDQGANMMDALNYWRNTGIGGDNLFAYAQAAPTLKRQVRQALWLFGGLYAGFALPRSAQTQTHPNGRWSQSVSPSSRAGRPGGWGLHACTLSGYGPNWIGVIPWGSPDVGYMTMTWQFLFTYCDELYACLSSQDWAENSLAPSGFNLSQLQADLAKIHN